MRIAELLNQKGSTVVTASPRVPVIQAIEEMTRRNIGAIVVTGNDNSVVGICSERDVVRALDESGAAILDAPIETIMSSKVFTCSLADDVESLMGSMTNRRIRHIPVLDSGELVGIISIGDVVKNRMEELEKDRDALVDYIGMR